MIWLGLVKRFWPYLAFALAALLIVGGIYRTAYKAGQREREAHYRPLFAAADKARAAADARATALETASRNLTAEYEDRHAQTLQALNEAAAASDVRVRGLMRQLAAAGRQQVCPVSGAPAIPDVPAEVIERADTIGARLVGIGRDCESDAAQLAELQRWIRDQQAILN